MYSAPLSRCADRTRQRAGVPVNYKIVRKILPSANMFRTNPLTIPEQVASITSNRERFKKNFERNLLQVYKNKNVWMRPKSNKQLDDDFVLPTEETIDKNITEPHTPGPTQSSGYATATGSPSTSQVSQNEG